VSETIPDRAVGDIPEEAGLDALIARAKAIADEFIAPQANQVDQSDIPPVDNIRRLADAGLLGLTTPVRYGGHGAPGALVRAYTEILAAACGTTTFIQGQHLSACSLIAAAENEELKPSVLPLFSSGERICGVAFAHLRRPGPPTMRVEQDGDYYVFNGIAPWFTGWGVMSDVMLAGTLPNGKYLYVVIPLEQGGRLLASPPMKLCAMNASGTVSLTCDNLRVHSSLVMKTITAEQMSGNDLGAILGVTSQIFGASTTSIALVRDLAQKRNSDFLKDTAQALDGELSAARKKVESWRDSTDAEGYKENALAARAWCIELAVRAAHAAVTASGGGANDRNNSAQRLFRESMFYTLTAQTRDVQTATLERLSERARTLAHETD
jgi:alkylation response protein AidB-like acyl-CoA dehydrogenase